MVATSPIKISKDDFGQRVRERAKALKIRKADLARLTGKTWPTVHAWWNGAQLPEDAETFRALAKALDMSVDELIGVTEGEPTHAAWLAFLETAEGRSMSADERADLAGIRWRSGEPSVLRYQMHLMAHRAGA